MICVPPGYVFPRTHIPRDMCSPEGIYVPPRRSDMRSPGICVPPLARASTGQTLASAGRDGSPRGRTRPSAHGRRGDESAPRLYIALVIATVHQYYHMYQYSTMHGRRDATTQIASRAFPRTCMATSLRASRGAT